MRLEILLFGVCALASGFCAANPSPFEVARQTGNNLSNSFRRVQDENAIKEILERVSCSKNPEDFQNAIADALIQVSPERQEAVIAYLQSRYNQLKSR